MMASGEIRLSTTTMRQMPVLAQSQTPQGQTSGDGLDEIVVNGTSPAPPSTFGATADPLDEIIVLGNTGGQITTPLGFSFTDARYTHIAVRHIGFKFPFTSQFYPAYGSKAALALLINLIVAAGPGVMQPNGNYNWTYNLGIPLGLDASSFGGSETSWLTLIVNPNASGGPTVWTMYPSGPVGP